MAGGGGRSRRGAGCGWSEVVAVMQEEGDAGERRLSFSWVGVDLECHDDADEPDSDPPRKL